MKCPHCGIHYMDDERECPVCGKRPGLLAPKKKSKFTSTNAEPTTPKKAKPAASTARKQTYNHKKPDSAQAAWQRASAGAHSHDNPLAAGARKKSKHTGCLVVVVVLVVFFLIPVLLSAISFHDITNSAVNWLDDTFQSNDYEYEDYDDIYAYCDPSDAFPSGTWVNEDASVTMVVDAEGTVFWQDSNGSFQDEYPLFERLELSVSNAADYCTEEELTRYPVSDYIHYTLWASDTDPETDDFRSLDLYLYIHNDTDPADVSTFDYYDRETGEYHTFTYVSTATVLPETVVSQPV